MSQRGDERLERRQSYELPAFVAEVVAVDDDVTYVLLGDADQAFDARPQLAKTVVDASYLALAPSQHVTRAAVAQFALAPLVDLTSFESVGGMVQLVFEGLGTADRRGERRVPVFFLAQGLQRLAQDDVQVVAALSQFRRLLRNMLQPGL